jgi:hypothetical protein
MKEEDHVAGGSTRLAAASMTRSHRRSLGRPVRRCSTSC